VRRRRCTTWRLIITQTLVNDLAIDAASGSDEAPSDESERRIARLERRLARERGARAQAESIADRRMRELWLANRELDERVADRTRELEQAMATQERMNRAAAGFLTNLNHEMFTPLNGIVGTLELLKDNARSEKDRSYIKAGLQSTDRLQQLLQRMHDLTELRVGRMTLVPITLRGDEISGAIEQTWRTPCLRAQKLLTVSSSAIAGKALTLDVQRLHQIVDELIANAVLHADPGVVGVDLRLESPTEAVEGRGLLVVVVSDAGPGFEYVAAANLLDAVSRVDYSPGRATDGAGIGLSLVTALLEALGGSLSLDTGPGQPTVAYASLPVGT